MPEAYLYFIRMRVIVHKRYYKTVHNLLHRTNVLCYSSRVIKKKKPMLRPSAARAKALSRLDHIILREI